MGWLDAYGRNELGGEPEWIFRFVPVRENQTTHSGRLPVLQLLPHTLQLLGPQYHNDGRGLMRRNYPSGRFQSEVVRQASSLERGWPTGSGRGLPLGIGARKQPFSLQRNFPPSAYGHHVETHTIGLVLT